MQKDVGRARGAVAHGGEKARLYPATPPKSGSAAEEQLFHLFKGLPGEYRVFHSVNWRLRGGKERGSDERGEVDFVVLHPRYGLLLLEAKGGKLRRDPELGSWFSENAEGAESEIQDPFLQVDRSLYAMRELLKEGVGTRRFNIPARTGVALIQTVVSGAIAPHAPRHAVIDSTDIPDLEAAIRRLYAEPLAHPLTQEAVEAVTDLLAPATELVRVGLNSRFEEIDRARLEPTESQRFLLDHFLTTPRAKVAGCAGSGKTLIALELARRLARAGQEVLFVCFNRRLALWAAAAVLDGSFPAGRVTVRHFHGLADAAFAAAGMPTHPNPEQPDWEGLPARMEVALKRAPMSFDALVVDEGQDFREEWWLLLFGELLRRPDEDPVYVFYDANQRIYTPSLELPAELPNYLLSANLRNTRQIHELVARYYRGDPPPRCEGPDGLEVAWINERPVEGVRRALNELLNVQGVPAKDVIVLSGRSTENSDLKEGAQLASATLTWLPAKTGEVQVSTVHAFKGLERRVVVLTELDQYLQNPERREYGEALAYIGASRATHHLMVVSLERL